MPRRHGHATGHGHRSSAGSSENPAAWFQRGPRLGVEYVADGKQGFGFIVDWVFQNGLPYRLDGHAITTDIKTFTLIGTAVAVEYKFTPEWVASMGALFTLAGRNNVDAIYPGFSMKYFWGRE